ncbi:hypothetical protein F2P81_002483 [Scophthalmus maximus]|uniref:Uncharacterized protein n=1 Tax=Scophthalmus maximus TaxID=52904 RepID=A0A6A4TRV1_SCOMX|nr:hypothetical protein F2P81_002483 [Scophthalmus maximus]
MANPVSVAEATPPLRTPARPLLFTRNWYKLQIGLRTELRRSSTECIGGLDYCPMYELQFAMLLFTLVDG